MMEKQNKLEKQAVGDADMTDYVIEAAVAGMEKSMDKKAHGQPRDARDAARRFGLAD